jgi:DNA-directed RNA polymerase subunit RPC12/RpoP
MPVPEYECRTCGRIFGIEQYKKDPYCPDCGMRIWPKFLIKPKRTKIEAIDPPAEVNLATIFAEFNRLINFDCGEGELINNVSSWFNTRCNAYANFRNKLTQGKLVSYEKLCDDYKQFLYFENNHSWTTLYRTGLKALENPEKLWRFITYLQDESIPICDRITETLEGDYYVFGIGKNITTGLLHMFYPDKYGVWNRRSEETLDLIRRKPIEAIGIGNKYLALNNVLKKLAVELDTDLTTIDGLMWYVSKRLKSQLKV